jgi:phosphate transport system substrate-binding protein
VSVRKLAALAVILATLGAGGSVGQGAPADELEDYPLYTAEAVAPGVIRNSGSSLGGLLKKWEEGFARYQPGIRFADDLRSGDAAIGALESGAADLAINGREPVLTEFLSFAEVFGHDGPFQITVATGSFDVLGRTWAEVIYVNRENPLSHLTLEQLDGIFGAARTGGYQGYKWSSAAARDATRDIRTWGQLGLKGEWARAPINTYGYAPTGMSNFFELTVFHGGTKWNPNYRQYVETSAKQATEHSGTTDQMLDDLSHDKYGIAWAGIAHARGKPNVKAIALGVGSNGPFVACTRATTAARTYPLTRSIFIQMERTPGSAMEPRIREFLRYILSRQGQAAVVEQGEYLTLTLQDLERQIAALQ